MNAELIARLNAADADYQAARHGDGLPDEAGMRDVGYNHGELFRAAAAALSTVPPRPGLAEGLAEFLGRVVRMEWMAWAREQPNPKPSWLTPWEELTEPEREVDRRIGERVYHLTHIPIADAAPQIPPTPDRDHE